MVGRRGANTLQPRASSGIWEGFIEGMQPGEVYKYHIVSQHQGYQVDKADPFALLRGSSAEDGIADLGPGLPVG